MTVCTCTKTVIYLVYMHVSNPCSPLLPNCTTQTQLFIPSLYIHVVLISLISQFYVIFPLHIIVV